MAAGIHEPTGTAAGRVTIWTTFASLIPPLVAIFVVVVCALLEILEKETAGAVILGILATAGLTTGAVFTTAKKTPTDQARLIWGSSPVADVVTPPPGTVEVPDDVEPEDGQETPEAAAATEVLVNNFEVTGSVSSEDLAAEVEAVRARRPGSTAAGAL